MSDAIIALIKFPLEDVINCEFCRKGIFRAASRKENYTIHLKKKHQIRTENIKIKCSACGRISDKPRLWAWRDTRKHYSIEHAELLETQRETVNKTVADQPLPDKSSTVPSRSHPDPRANEETKGKIATQSRKINDLPDGVIDLSKTRQAVLHMNRMDIVKSHSSLPPAPKIQWNNPVVVDHPKDCPLKVPAAESLVTKKQRESKCHSTSKILAAMGHMFDVVASAAADCQAPTTSTPEKQLPTDNNGATPSAAIHTEDFLSRVSRIMPRARPALRRSWKRRLTSPTPDSPSKKLQTCAED